MAGVSKSFADLEADDINVHLPDNASGEVDPVEHRQSNLNWGASTINRIDDNLDTNKIADAGDGSAEYTVDPFTSIDLDSIVNNNKLPNIKLIKDNFIRSAVVSDTYAFVDENGNDTNAEVGNPFAPFATFAAALSALPASNFVITALGGTFTEDIIVTSRSNFTINLISCTLNGFIFLNASPRGSLELSGTTVNGRLVLGDLCRVNGGKIVNSSSFQSLSVGEGSFVYGVDVSSSSTGFAFITPSTFDSNNRSIIQNCRIVSAISTAIDDARGCHFVNCEIKGTRGFVAKSGTTNEQLCKFTSCRITGTTSQAMSGENGSLQGIFENCRIESESVSSLLLGGSPLNLFFKNCDIIGDTNCIDVNNDINRAGNDNVYESCRLYAGSGVIISEGTMAVDTGFTRMINCTFNKAFSTSFSARHFEYNTTTIVGLTEVPI